MIVQSILTRRVRERTTVHVHGQLESTGVYSTEAVVLDTGDPERTHTVLFATRDLPALRKIVKVLERQAAKEKSK